MRCRVTFLIFIFLLAFSQLQAQMSAPEVEGVYGGRVNAIEILPLDSTSIRIFTATESANSLFYSDVDFASPDGPEGTPFTVLPDAGQDDNMGGNIRDLSADWHSGYLFFINNSGLYSINIDEGSLSEVAPNGVSGLKAHDGWLFYVGGPGLSLYFGTIDSVSGAFNESADSPLEVVSEMSGGPNGIRLFVNPANKHIYIAKEGHPVEIYKSSAVYDSLDSATTFSALLTDGMGDHSYRAFGMGPDGRLFAGGTTGKEPNISKFIAWTDDDGATWDTVNTEIPGIAPGSITCSYDSAYAVYFGTSYSKDMGKAGSWSTIGWQEFETHPNDGAVAVAPFQPGMVTMTTDMGIGASMDYGASIFEIGDGLEAVQINDFDMNAAKTDAWVASKSGVRRVSGYATDYEDWQIFFPNGDGSPYYSVAVDKQRPDTAYAGNVRLYRTFDGGVNWNQVFRTEDYSGDGLDFSSTVKDVAVHPDSSRFVVLGINSRNEGVRGAVFYSFDFGQSWSRVETDVYNTEVNRLAFHVVDEDSFTVYVACEYVSDGTTSSYGVKKIGFRFSDESAHFENDMIGESGGVITNFGANDVDINEFGDVIAAGTNSAGEPRVYGLQADSLKWMSFSTAGFPDQGQATALSWGFDAYSNNVPYVAVNNTLFALDTTFSNWEPMYNYPVGSNINVLYWDDLLVGTGTGLYAQYLSPTGIKDLEKAPGSFELSANYPNPFNPETILQFRLGVNSIVTLSVYDVAGRKIADVVQGVRSAGTHKVTFNASRLASGVYFYRMKARPVNGGRAFVQTRRMLLLK